MQEKLSTLLLDTFLPNQCIICNKLNKFNLCDICAYNIPNKPSLWINKNVNSRSIFIPKNITKIQPPLDNEYINSILSCSEFKNTSIKKSIHYLKYKNLPQISTPLGAIMLRAIGQHLTSTDNILLCPIPVHPNRLKWRGYNQSQLLAEYLNRQIGIKIYTGLIKVKDTKSQMRIKDRYHRIMNLNDAFIATIKSTQQNQTILIIDDVTTTLSTITQAAKALKKQGFHDINALILAH